MFYINELIKSFLYGCLGVILVLILTAVFNPPV